MQRRTVFSTLLLRGLLQLRLIPHLLSQGKLQQPVLLGRDQDARQIRALELADQRDLFRIGIFLEIRLRAPVQQQVVSSTLFPRISPAPLFLSSTLSWWLEPLRAADPLVEVTWICPIRHVGTVVAVVTSMSIDEGESLTFTYVLVVMKVGR